MNASPAGPATVRFSGLPAVTAPLTWSQFGMWTAIRKFSPHDAYLNVRFHVEVPEHAGLDDVLSAVREVLVRHEALRTRYLETGSGAVVQQVAGSGEVEVLLEDEADGGLARLEARLADRSFRCETDLPVRFSIVHNGGRPVWLVVVVSHLSIDGLARNQLMRELSARLAGDHRYGEGEDVLTPVARALEENTERGIRLNDRTVDRWRRFLDRVEVTNFPRRLHDERQPRWMRASLCSPALGLAVDRIADRNRVTTPAVYIALSATAVSVLSGRPVSVFRCMISNRFTDAEKRYIGNISQACAFDVPVGRAVFDEVVRRAMTASIRGYAIGRYRTDVLDAIVDPLRFDAMHNDFRDTAAPLRPQDLAPDPEIHALRSRTVVEPGEELDYYDNKFLVEVQQGIDGPRPVALVDRCHLPVADPGEVLLAMEELALSVLSDRRDVPAAEVFASALARPQPTQS